MKKMAIILIILGIIIVPACGKRSWVKDKGFTSEKQSEVAAIDASVISVIPWKDVQSELQPVFPMNATQALNDAIPVTLSEERRILNSLNWYLKVALTQKLTTINSSTIKKYNLEPETYENRTEQFIQPNLTALNASNSIDPEGNFNASHLKNNQVNPRMQYSAATALYQEVRLLNKYVKYASKRKGYTPYLVRMQVSLTPMADDARYDAYSTISFFPDRFSEKKPLTDIRVLFKGDGNFKGVGTFKGKGVFSGSGIFNGDGDFMDQETQKVTLHNNTETFKGNGKFTGECLFTGEGMFAGKGLFNGTGTFDGEGKCINKRYVVSEDGRTPFVVPLLASEDLERASFSRNNEDILQMAMALQATINSIGAETGFDKTIQDQLKMSGTDYNSLMTVGRITDNSIRVRFGAMQTATELGEGKKRVMVPRTHYVNLLLMVPGTPPDNYRLEAIARTTLVNHRTGKKLEGKDHDAIVGGARNLLKKYGIETPRRIDEHEKLIHGFYTMAIDVQTNKWENFKEHFDKLCYDIDRIDEEKVEWNNFCHNASEGLREQIWTEMADLWVGGKFSYTSFEVPEIVIKEKPKMVFPNKNLSFIGKDDGSKTVIHIAGARHLNAAKLSPALTVQLGRKKFNIPPSSISLTNGGNGCELTFPSFAKVSGFKVGSTKIKLIQEQPEQDVLYMDVSEKEQKIGLNASSSMGNILIDKGQGTLQASFSGVDKYSVMKIKNAVLDSGYLATKGFSPAGSSGWYKIPRNGIYAFPLTNLSKGTPVILTTGKATQKTKPLETGTIVIPTL